MSVALRRFDAYQASSVRWVENIPMHWRSRRIKTFLREVDERSGTGKGALLTMRRANGLVPLAEFSGKIAEPDRLRHYKLASSGQIVMNPMQAGNGMFAVCYTPGLISPDYRAFALSDEADARYLIALFKSEPMRATFRAESKGLGTGTAGFLRLYPDRFGSLFAPFPPPDEQRRIANFLDAYTTPVHRLIAAKRRTIVVLIERKQAIIEELLGARIGRTLATTRHAEVGDIPEHWRVARLKDWCYVNARTLSDSTPGDYSFDYFDISVVGTGVLTGEPEAMTFDGAPSRARRRLASNDILISTVRTYLKAIYFFQGGPRDAIASTGFAVLTPKAGVLPELLAYALMSPRFIDVVISRSVGVAYPAIAETRLSALHLALPPDEFEQYVILNAIKADTKLVDKTIANERRQINLLLEYRDSLIAAVVTGRLDVRDAVVHVVETSDLLGEVASETEEIENAFEAVD
jgi:type I restriction enzyme S subunit